MLLQALPRICLIKKRLQECLPVLDRVHMYERLLDPLAQHTDALRCLAAVQQTKQTGVLVRNRPAFIGKEVESP